MLDYFALLVIFVIVAAGIWIAVLLGNLPGNMARAADHPQAEAISLLGWIGLLTMGLGWFAALVWAKYRPPAARVELEARIKQLEGQLQEGKAS